MSNADSLLPPDLPPAATPTLPPNPPPPPGLWIDRVLTRLLLAIMALMLLAGAYVLWQVGQTIGQVHAMLVNTTADLKQVTQTTANLARQVDAVTERVDRMVTKSQIAMRADDMEELLDAAIAAEKPAPVATADRQALEADMKYLLDTIWNSGSTFKSGGKTFSAATFYWKAYIKYKTWHKSVQSAEEFIGKLSDRMFTPEDYVVVGAGPDSGDQPLQDWLTAALKAHRTAATKP